MPAHLLWGLLLAAVALGLTLAGSLRRGPTGPRRVAALGDSITAHGGWAKELARLLPRGSEVRVFAKVGAGAREILGLSGEALVWRPTDLVVLAGVNDVASGRSLSAIADALGGIYSAGRQAGARVVAVHVLPWAGYGPSGYRDVRRTATGRLNDWISVRSGADAVVETHTLGDAHGRLRSTSDGLHPNGEGQRALGRLIFESAFR